MYFGFTSELVSPTVTPPLLSTTLFQPFTSWTPAVHDLVTGIVVRRPKW